MCCPCAGTVVSILYSLISLKQPREPGSVIAVEKQKQRTDRGAEKWRHLLMVPKGLSLGALAPIMSVRPLNSEVLGSPM